MKCVTHWCLVALWSLGCVQGLGAQDLEIRNARVIVGTGELVERGTILVRRGRIASILAAPASGSDVPVLDAGGLTAIPGLIDANRQVIQGDPAQWMAQAPERMRAYVEAGFTTVLSAGDSLEHVLELRDRLDAREIPGPRLLVSGAVRLVTDGEIAWAGQDMRERVRALSLEGADAIASFVVATTAGIERDALSIARDEADLQGLLTITHIQSVQDAFAAVEGGSGYLTQTPWVGELDTAMARALVENGRSNAEYGLVMTSALGASTANGGMSFGPENARRLRDAGIIYGFGTNTTLRPSDALRHELEMLQQVFSNAEILDMLTRSGAFAVRRDDALGTLEPGKIADIVMLDGDPLDDLLALSRVKLVVKTGRILVDQR